MAPGVFGPMPAKLAQAAGFKAIYVPGGGVSLNRLGVADVGVITMTEMVETAAAITQAVSLPVIADADTGFGNQLNVQRTVREYERAGVAGIHIEDQLFPKRCGHFEGKALIPLEEAVQKIRAAVDARQDPDFLIIARCDAMNVNGFEDVEWRCAAYRDAGADMIFVDSPRSMDDIENIPRVIDGPHVFNMSAGGKAPALSVNEVGELGYKLMIMPNFAALAAIKAMQEIFADIMRTGSIAEIRDRCASFAEFTELGGIAEFREIEKRFGVGQSVA